MENYLNFGLCQLHYSIEITGISEMCKMNSNKIEIKFIN